MTGAPTVTGRPKPPEPRNRIVLWAAIAASLVILAGIDFIFFPPPSLPIATEDAAQILAAHPAKPLYFRFRPDPSIVVIAFPTANQQSATFNRITALLLRAGTPHDRVLSDPELAAVIRTSVPFTVAHAYRAQDLVRFFRLMSLDHVAPNPDERRLHLLLGVLHWFAPGAVGAIVALGPSDQAARASLLSHALANAAYFVSPAYAVYAEHFFHDSLTLPEQALFTRYLAAHGYDTDLTGLVVNETQSLLCFTPAFDPAAIGLAPSQIQSLRTRFLQKIPLHWLKSPGALPLDPTRAWGPGPHS